MGTTVSATEARVHLGELMRRVAEDHEPIVVERDGQSQAVLVPTEEYEQLRLAGRRERWIQANALIEQVHRRIRAESDGRPLPDVSDLIHEMREERDAQILDAVLGREHGGSASDRSG
jgi:prevent-host-death family protein